MSEASESAELSIQLADFALTDPAGKLNIIGGGVAALGYSPESGTTTRFTLVATAKVPARLCPLEIVLEFALLDALGNTVELPGPAGTPQKLRIGQAARVEKPGIPGGPSFPDTIPARYVTILDFSNGLPLALGQAYAWQFRIDGDTENAVTEHFLVPGPPPPPVFG